MLYARLPHLWILVIIFALSIIACVISATNIKRNPYVSSVFANIFAGLITGVVISLISTIKSASLYRTECLIAWLEALHKDILDYKEMYKKIIVFKKGDIEDDEIFYNYVYDTLCLGNSVNLTISQGRFDYSLPFDSYNYIKNKLGYDAIECAKNNEELREKIIELDVKSVTPKELRRLFDEMDRQLTILNHDILKHIVYLKARRKAINISFM